MTKALVVLALATCASTFLLGCPDKAGDGAKPAAAPATSGAAAVPASAAPKAGGGGW